ncbi:MAG TPA: lipoyl synthase [Spirochaetia bacterium]|nr:lipoyl synthase [Spirochaetia bacterium]
MTGPKPEWLRKVIRDTPEHRALGARFKALSLHTVCREANCPNRSECFTNGNATFLILGDVCSRHCTFCNVQKGRPDAPDPTEPERVARAVAELGLRHAVITSVTRDDLSDGGARFFADTIRWIRELTPTITMEVLIPDFAGDPDALQSVIQARPHIINHNLETVPRLYAEVRPGADFNRSLTVLSRVKAAAPGIHTKSGIMVGLGETKEEVREVLSALRRAGCEMLTIGQYLAPSRSHYPVKEYVHPDCYIMYAEWARELGFRAVAAGPFVRSSYQAARVYREISEPGSVPFP